ncbi:ChbG/HpnK family deacetylase [Nitratireductor basaltis]|uniref:Hopanoid biosynthesis associated protein HpnK n=1 Tax=Nitratireductor basaltis TaxID=472175 RepID=A0A084UDW4_9HYPH|nr:ChbG/HpnK family deacetylase [Nitratireductor basaltis]KFB11150.1 hopanoid biosynthesis associated protein HpnK [Nitratireductor basaltis]
MSGEKTFLPHLDDVGATAGSVIAWKALREAGTVTSASVMVPCPYYPMAVEDFQADPAQDLGIHITLTSEWSRYRWRPLIGNVGGLCDADGYFHRRPQDVLTHADPIAVEEEMQAQIERAFQDGIKPTHIDAHMGTAFLTPFMDGLWKLAERYQLAVPFCRDSSALFKAVRAEDADLGLYRELTAQADAAGEIVFDSFQIGFTPQNHPADVFFAEMLGQAPGGLHWLALHANAPDDTAHFAPHMVWPRTQEHALFSAPESRKVFAGSRLVNWHALGPKRGARACAC